MRPHPASPAPLALDPRRGGRLLLVLALALSTAHLSRYAHPAWLLDDAYISFRAARSWVELGLPTFNREGAPVEAMTNLGWTALLAATGRPEHFPSLARWMGVASWLGALALLLSAALRLGGLRAGAVAALVLVASPSPHFYAMSGLETAGWALIVAAAAALVLGPASPPRAALLGTLLGLGFTLRPEVALYGPALVLAVALRARAWLWALLPLALIGVGVEAWRLHVFGAWVPNTFHAKPPDGGGGVAYALRFLRSTGLAAPVALWVLFSDRRLAPLGAWACLVVAAVVWSGGDWMDGYRRLTELGLLAALGLGIGAASADRRVAALSLVAASSWVIASGVAVLRHTDDRFTLSGTHLELAQRAQASGLARVALADIGIFGWIYRGEILDTAGLADAAMARAPGGHGGKWSEARFREFSPEVLLISGRADARGTLHFAGPDRFALRSALVLGGYRLHATSLEHGDPMLVLVREDLQLDPAIWGEAAGPDATEGLRRHVAAVVPAP